MLSHAPLKPIHDFFLRDQNMIQLALELTNENEVKNVIDYLDKSVMGLHLCVHDKLIKQQNEPIKVLQLPNHLSSLEDCANYSFENFTPDFRNTLGTISVNKNKLVLNILHSFCDGGFMKILINNFQKPTISNKPDLVFPTDIEVEYKDRIENSPNVLTSEFEPNLTRCFSHDKNEKNFDQNSKYTKFYTIKMDSHDFKRFDTKKNIPKDVTGSLWVAHYFAACCQERKILPICGFPTVVDTRAFLERPIHLGDCNFPALVNPYTKVNSKMTLSEVALGIRKNLLEKLANNEQYSFFKFYKGNNKQVQPGFRCELSNLGPIQLHGPIKDLWVSSNRKAPLANPITMFSFSVVDPSKSTNKFNIRLKYSSKCFSDVEGKTYSNNVEYLLKNIDFDRTVEDVFDEMKSLNH
ncbi:hypothetical protein TRFO_14991 [Tritrichomonas foetus]|uniref:Condensation domain-containing protein n=1 Tax=Tritrichomonas foetus TaxID=1144522 RepID=A0A1J4KTW9_9EUKA|nr:hypothetical protein TRFO_14991 [Tritrichomonas foetus]|eukprot:OHT14586.1 hypothetical protein TRFO_14991 [Tritrichomonas foetus]